jgi:hypothetical protein
MKFSTIITMTAILLTSATGFAQDAEGGHDVGNAGLSTERRLDPEDRAEYFKIIENERSKQSYYCYRNQDIFGPDAVAEAKSKHTYFKDLKTGYTYVYADLVSTMPRTDLGLPEETTWKDIGNNEFEIAYPRKLQNFSRNAAFSKVEMQYEIPGIVKYIFTTDAKGKPVWLRTKYDLQIPDGNLAYVRCSKLTEKQNRSFFDFEFYNPQNIEDITLGKKSCHGNRKECAEMLGQPMGISN